MQYTKFLLHFNDSSNPWKDEVKGSSWTASGSPSLTTTNAKFGSALNIDNGYTHLISNNTVAFDKTDFTIDFWYKSNNTRNWANIIGFGTNKTYVNYCTGFCLEVENANQLIYSVKRSGDGPNYIFTSGDLTKLHHIAMVYSYSTKTLKWYIDGVLKNTNTVIDPMIGNCYFYIGEDLLNGGQEANNACVIDEFRVSTCQRWTSDFTPPTSPYIMSLAIAEFPSTRFGTYDKSPNGLKYKYRVRFEQGPYTETSNVVNYVTEHKRRQPWAA